MEQGNKTLQKLSEVNERFKSGVGQGSKKYANDWHKNERRKNVNRPKVGFHAEIAEAGSAIRETESPSPVRLNDEKKNYLLQMYGTPRRAGESPTKHSPTRRRSPTKRGLNFNKIRLTPTKLVRTPNVKKEKDY